MKASTILIGVGALAATALTVAAVTAFMPAIVAGLGLSATTGFGATLLGAASAIGNAPVIGNLVGMVSNLAVGWGAAAAGEGALIASTGASGFGLAGITAGAIALPQIIGGFLGGAVDAVIGNQRIQASQRKTAELQDKQNERITQERAPMHSRETTVPEKGQDYNGSHPADNARQAWASTVDSSRAAGAAVGNAATRA